MRLVARIPTWLKVLAGAVLIVASIVIAVATSGASLGLEAELLGSTVAVTAAAKTVLIELSIGIGLAATNWAISSLGSGNWNIAELTNTIADTVFFTGLFLFVQTGISALMYLSRTLVSYELDPLSIKLAKKDNPSWEVFRKRVWQNEVVFNKRAYSRKRLRDMEKVWLRRLRVNQFIYIMLSANL